ncbi:MAG: hypothetical protein KIT84_35255 [Labilithrix sp.]|nr:hypothetical protein [Labilithrix sp.]MCW5816309.1 hypothetical protein [Labilithrix sp.]
MTPCSAKLLLALSVLVVSGCAGLRAVTAPPNDLEDYRAFRVAAADGIRLARAKRYLERHPDGVWAAEVKAIFDEEEQRYFEEAQTSRAAARRYLTDLPDGPHAEAALALLIALESSIEDAELADLARRVRNDDARLERAAVQRRAVGEAILGALGVFLDEDTYGKPRADASPSLRALMQGPRGATWGGVPAAREDDHFFLLPTRPERESRLLTLETRLVEEDGVVVASSLEGSDLIVRWAEADQIVRLDSSAPEDRTEAQIFALGRLEGALERRFPAGTCEDLRRGDELYHRSCNGWEGVVTAGTKPGDKDAVMIRSPHGRKPSEPR